jgi:hypothetical protein
MGTWNCNLIVLNLTLDSDECLRETALRNYGIIGWMGRGADVEKVEHIKSLPLAASNPESTLVQSIACSVQCLHIPAAEPG